MAFGLLDSAFALLLEEVAARVTLTGLPPAGQALSLQLLKETLRKNLNLTAFMSPLKKFFIGIAQDFYVLKYFSPEHTYFSALEDYCRSVELFKHPTGIGTFLSLDAGIDMAKANNTGVFDYFSALHTSLISRFRASAVLKDHTTAALGTLNFRKHVDCIIKYALLQDSAFTHELLTLLQGQAHLPFNELQASVNWLLDELDSESSPFIRLATHNACNSTGQPEMFIEYQLPSTMSLLMANTEVLSHSALLLLKLKLSLAHLYNNKSRANFIRHEFAAAFRLQTTLSAVDQDISLHLETARRTVLTIISVSGGCLSSLAGALHGFMSSIQSACLQKSHQRSELERLSREIQKTISFTDVTTKCL
ncbi:uncharacterized protein LOC135120596 isoform X2 [Zophobas morio]|uniref:uncharacterized protein LOC135120596 isoform X2 n=1 Tax=Zophobas morio TaxID=2755281 RepID=UPI003082D956